MYKVVSHLRTICTKSYVCKVVLAFTTICSLLLSSVTEAKITDLTQVRCVDIFPNGTGQVSDRDQRHFMLLVFWLGGFEAGAQPSTLVDITRIQEIATTLLTECSKHPEETCFSLLKQSADNKVTPAAHTNAVAH